jgi:hypothetical protein
MHNTSSLSLFFSPLGSVGCPAEYSQKNAVLYTYFLQVFDARTALGQEKKSIQYSAAGKRGEENGASSRILKS